MSDNDFWADKFIKRETIPAGKLAKRFNISNPRTHPESQRAATEMSLNRLGWIDEVSLSTNGDGPASLADNPDAILFDGHERVELALMRGPDTPVPTNWYQLTPERTQEALLTKDLTAQMAGINIPALQELRFELPDFENPAFDEFLTTEFEFDFGGGNGTGGETEPQIDKAEALQEIWQVASGDLWELGPHRIICGDCTDAAVVERVMGGERAQSVICDPPFFVRGDEWDKFKDDNQFISFLSSWIKLGIEIADTVVSFMADHNVPLLRIAAAQVNAPFRRSLVWRKPPGSQFAGASLDGFWFDFEMINVFGKPSFKPDKNTKMAVLEHRTITGQEHGCEKPIELLEDLINGYSEQGEIVTDFFLGTGTTLIACHNLNRRCRGIEIHPPYVSVCLDRFKRHTGIQPRRLSG